MEGVMDKKLYRMMNWEQIEAVVYSDTDRPDLVLGAHSRGSGVLVQAFFPGARRVWIVPEKTPEGAADAQGGERLPMAQADEEGFFAVFVPGVKQSAFRYEYEVEDAEGVRRREPETYRFAMPEERETEEAFHAGVGYDCFRLLGAHPQRMDGTEGCAFAVYAPHAARVSVVGDFNGWDGRLHPMIRAEDSAFFRLFVPGVRPGMLYKFEIKLRTGVVFLKSDPFAFGSEAGAEGASIVRALPEALLGDDGFVEKRGEMTAGTAPLSVCEVNLPDFAGKCRYGELALRLCEHVRAVGCTHVLLRGLSEAVTAGERRTVRSFFAPNGALGTPDELRALVGLLHHRGIGVLAAFSPISFARSSSGMNGFDGLPLYETGDSLRDETPEGDAVYFDYGRPEVRSFLLANALYWVGQYRFDGLSVGDIARQLYLNYGKEEGRYRANLYGGVENPEAEEFFRQLNTAMEKCYPGVLMIAEGSSGWPGTTSPAAENGLGFSCKYQLRWEWDMARYFGTDPYFRRGAHALLADPSAYQYAERYVLPLRGADWLSSMPGTRPDKYANLRLLLTLQMTMPGRKLTGLTLVDGEAADARKESAAENKAAESAGEQEKCAAENKAAESAGQHGKRAAENAAPEDSPAQERALRDGLRRLQLDLHRLYREQSALTAKDGSPDGFQWVRCTANEHCVVSFLRRGRTPDDFLLVVCNMANAAWEEEIGVPYEGGYREIFSSDRTIYGGGSAGSGRLRRTHPGERDGRTDYLRLQCPPLTTIVLAYKGAGK